MDAKTQKTIDFDRAHQLRILDGAHLPAVKVIEGQREVSVSAMMMKSALRTIYSFMGENVEAWPGATTLAKQMNCNERSVRRAVKGLIALSLLITERRSRGGRNTVNHYRIVWTELARVTPDSTPIKRTLCPVDTARSNGHSDAIKRTLCPDQTDTMSGEPPIEPPNKTSSPLSPHRQSGTFTLVRRSPRGRRDFGFSNFERTRETMDHPSLFDAAEANISTTARHPVDEPAPPKPTPKETPQTPPVKTVKQRIYDAKRRAVRLGLQGPSCVTTALNDGADISAIEAVLAYYEANPGAWGPGALHCRILNSPSMDDPAFGWPQRNVVKPKTKPAAGVQKDPVLRWQMIRAELVKLGRKKDADEELIRQVLEKRLEQFVAEYPADDRVRISAAIEMSGGAY